jgi:hypothetical protein
MADKALWTSAAIAALLTVMRSDCRAGTHGPPWFAKLAPAVEAATREEE